MFLFKTNLRRLDSVSVTGKKKPTHLGPIDTAMTFLRKAIVVLIQHRHELLDNFTIFLI
jgi:hypothetical protein